MMNSIDELAAAEAALVHLRQKPRMSAGMAAYHLYYRPSGWIGRTHRTGWGNSVRGACARRSLTRSFQNSGPRETKVVPSAAPLSVDLLTGHRFWAESIATARSLSSMLQIPLAYHFHDDGTLRADEVAALRRWVPGAVVRLQPDTEALLSERLPPARFPCLHRLRGVNVLLRKLMDIAALHHGWRLFIDSDVLLFRPPLEAVKLIAAGQAFHLADCDSFYGAAVDALSGIAGCAVDPKVNSGFYFHDVDAIDWDFVEHAARRQLAGFGFSYFIEQSLQAMLFARAGTIPLGSDYLVLPSTEECARPTRVLHHYVNQSRWAFYVNAWRQHQRLQTA